ncbi:MAG: glycosyltransferase family 4 protein [bacterium]|nr:glycosyltransferase family 4 protein [bacterium]
MQNKIVQGVDGVKNLFFSGKLSYVVENKTWVVNEVALSLLEGLKRTGFKETQITTSRFGLQNQVVHFGSVNTFLKNNGFVRVHPSNKVVLTWFHCIPTDPRNKYIQEAQKTISLLHTSCSLTKNELIKLGVQEEKIKVIPLGVDLALFKPALEGEKEALKKELSIPSGSFVVGSFQKDGVGWSEGLEPKLIKGPDVFVKAVAELAKVFPIFVLLVGPARGYVKRELAKRGIPFLDVGFLKEARDVAKYYQALDLYIVSSRIEGGPQSILESLASSVALVSTKVGLAPDVITDGQNGFLAGIEDVAEIVQKASEVLSNRALRSRLALEGRKTALEYSWEKIAQRYLNEIYLKLL